VKDGSCRERERERGEEIRRKKRRKSLRV
jgi:hypothetical protein